MLDIDASEFAVTVCRSLICEPAAKSMREKKPGKTDTAGLS